MVTDSLCNFLIGDVCCSGLGGQNNYQGNRAMSGGGGGNRRSLPMPGQHQHQHQQMPPMFNQVPVWNGYPPPPQSPYNNYGPQGYGGQGQGMMGYGGAGAFNSPNGHLSQSYHGETEERRDRGRREDRGEGGRYRDRRDRDDHRDRGYDRDRVHRPGTDHKFYFSLKIKKKPLC